jgi:hypothetical protein
MRDGAVRVAFRPRLSAEQYSELMEIVRHATTQAELRAAVTAAADRWQCELMLDEATRGRSPCLASSWFRRNATGTGSCCGSRSRGRSGRSAARGLTELRLLAVSSVTSL